MASSVGSDVFAVVAFLAISLAVLLLLRYYLPLRTTPAFLLLPIFFSLALPTSALLLVPIDLASSAHASHHGGKGIWLPERAVLVSWRIVYWLTFVLSWFILGILGEYMDAGYREPRDRIVYSLRSNARYQLMVLGCALAGLVYMIFSYGFDLTAIRGLVMALAYVWGLALAIYLMGHGLVAVPRNLFRRANISGSLRRVQGHAPKVREKLDDAVDALEEIVAQVAQLKQRKTGTARDFQEWIEELVEMTGDRDGRVFPIPTANEAGARVPAVITERYLADLTRRLVRAKYRRARYINEWDNIVQSASDLQAILDSKASKKLEFGGRSPSSSRSRFSLMTPYLRYHLHVHVFPAARIALGGILSLASVAILWSEIIKFPAPHLSAVSLTVIHHPSQKDYQIGLGGQLIASLWITYMVFCALSSITSVPTWNQRALVRRHTYPESATWYSIQVIKLTVPLAYNFLTFLPRDIHRKTTFYAFLGQFINLTPLGTWFDYLFPILILFPVCATLFNLYGRLKRLLGFDIIDDEGEEENPSGFGTGGWREGRDLIARDLQGTGPTALGLSDSPRPSLDIARTRGAAPTRWVPPSERPVPTSGPASSATAAAAAAAALPGTSRTLGAASTSSNARPPLDPEPDEENFFTLFGRRVKNTFDTLEAPRWLKPDSSLEGGDGGSDGAAGIGIFRRPKWMGGADDIPAVPQGSTDADPGNNTGRNLLGLFGGGRDGRIML